MKTNSPLMKSVLMASGLAAVFGLSALLTASKMPRKYVAHEWGTFTSVQGGDGALLDWRPLETARLPGFVYDWTHPGLNRQAAGGFAPGGVLTKRVMITLQRMETPVIYFYGDEEQTVDVEVKFPQGQITEWYPQAAQIGPSTVPIPPAIAMLDNYVHNAGVKPAFTFASLLRNKPVSDSRARWQNVRILPAKQHRELARSLPLDRSGSHYFSARDTDADYVRVNSLVATNPLPEHEQFIFYRGVGNFATPLRVTMNAGSAVTLANTCQAPLVHLFVLGLEGKAGGYSEVDRLAPGEQLTIDLARIQASAPVETISRRIGERMTESLVSQGLYRREATAMVNTWKDSWFAEDGVRVLYLLPRAWTDGTLPLALDPAPRELGRVMVGRAEVLSPARVHKLSEELVKAKQGETAARERAVAEFRKLGRFGEPALRLAAKGMDGSAYQTAWTLLQASAKPAADTRPL